MEKRSQPLVKRLPKESSQAFLLRAIKESFAEAKRLYPKDDPSPRTPEKPAK